MKGNVIYIKEGHWQEVEVRVVDIELAEMKGLVGGWIEQVVLGDYVLLCDEEGKLKSRIPTLVLPNGDVICGSVVILGLNNRRDDWRGLTEPEIEAVVRCLRV